MSIVNEWLNFKSITQPNLSFQFDKENLHMQSRMQGDKKINIKANLFFLDKLGSLETDYLQINASYMVVLAGKIECREIEVHTNRFIFLNAKFAADNPKLEPFYENQRVLTKEFQKILDSIEGNQKAEDLFSRFEQELHELKRPKEKGETPPNLT